MAIKDGEFTYIKATGPIIEFDDEDDEDDEDAHAHVAKRSAAEEKNAKKEERGANGAAAVPSKRASLDAAPGSEIEGAAPRTARGLPGEPDKITKTGSLTMRSIARKRGRERRRCGSYPRWGLCTTRLAARYRVWEAPRVARPAQKLKCNPVKPSL